MREQLKFSKISQVGDRNVEYAKAQATAAIARIPKPKGKTVLQEIIGSLTQENKHMSKQGDIIIGGKAFHMRSSWERNYARYLQWLKERKEIKDWTYECKRFEFPERHGNNSYLPDFQITEKDGSITWVEIKGYMNQGSMVKIKRFMKYYPEEKLQLIDKEQYRALAISLKNLIAGWE